MTTLPLIDAWERPRRPARAAGAARRAPSLTEGGRRALNVTVAAVALVLTLPLLLLIAIAVKLTSPGPVLYTQTRVGLNRRRRHPPPGSTYRSTDCGGQPFKIYKFRTMQANGHGPSHASQVWAAPNDPRVTRIGRFLRLYRLDELPQLFNVLRGEMEIVGPRPEQPAIFQRLRAEIPGYQERQRVRPGITGWAQINQSYDQTVEDVRRKLAYDVEYIRRCSALEDLRIMLRTLPVVMGKRGAW